MSYTTETAEQVSALSSDKYKYGFVTDIESDLAPKGLNEDINKAKTYKNIGKPKNPILNIGKPINP